MEWLVLPHVSQGGKTGLDLLLFDYLYCSLWYCLRLVVGVRVWLGTTIVIVGTIRIISGLVFFSLELTALILIVAWFFTMVACWFGLVGVFLWGLLRHSVYGHFVWSFQSIQFQIPFEMQHNLFIRAILQVRLVYRFFQVGRHFGIDELLDDRLSGNSECVFRQFLDFI